MVVRSPIGGCGVRQLTCSVMDEDIEADQGVRHAVCRQFMLSLPNMVCMQPRACKGQYPIFNKEMVQFNTDMRMKFMESLAKKLNRPHHIGCEKTPIARAMS